MIKAIFFDLDGTLLPMDQDVFVKSYFSSLCYKLIPHGFQTEELVKNIWTGIKSMMMNDGSKTNEEVFWNHFKTAYGEDVVKYHPVFQEYYEKEFQVVQKDCGFNPESAKVIEYAKNKDLRLFLATNPVFPQAATFSRIRWAGLNAEDFEIITTYENSHSTKPNPKYYAEILEKAQLQPEECLMVGNDVREDMVAQTLGMKVFLLTNDVIAHGETDLSKYPQGDFDALYQYIDELKK